VVCLCLDRHYKDDGVRVMEMAKGHGAKARSVRPFIDGKGTILPIDMYDQFSPTPPASWTQTAGAYAHFHAVKQIVRRAQEDCIANLLLLEHDCEFTPDFDEVVGLACDQVREHHIEWDMLYYGANHTWATTEAVSPNLLRCFGSYTTHCVGIRCSIYDAILDLPERHVIDNVIANCLHHRFGCYAIWPNVALQRPGWSNISNVPCDYTEMFKCKGANHP
jgi:hypothetical protein